VGDHGQSQSCDPAQGKAYDQRHRTSCPAQDPDHSALRPRDEAQAKSDDGEFVSHWPAQSEAHGSFSAPVEKIIAPTAAREHVALAVLSNFAWLRPVAQGGVDLDSWLEHGGEAADRTLPLRWMQLWIDMIATSQSVDASIPLCSKALLDVDPDAFPGRFQSPLIFHSSEIRFDSVGPASCDRLAFGKTAAQPDPPQMDSDDRNSARRHCSSFCSGRVNLYEWYRRPAAPIRKFRRPLECPVDASVDSDFIF